jgi:hypothetical protein
VKGEERSVRLRWYHLFYTSLSLTRRCDEVSQSHEATGEDERDVRDTSLGAPGKDLGSVSITSHTVQGSGSNVLVRVGGREGKDQDARVDQGGKTLDSGRGDYEVAER